MKLFDDTKEKLNKIGCGFCIAKWAQVTIHLHYGHNHSCHHPKTHKISEDEIKLNPSALHNTLFKKEKRKEMLEGKRPEECIYCWNVEDNSKVYSDRILKSAEVWAAPYYNQITKSDWKEDFNPTYVEVSFSNTCNFKCSYCAPPFSTRWTEEIEKHGGYPTSDNFNSLEHFKDRVPYRHDEINPYVEAFWKWWPTLYRDLVNFRITGGEPLLSDDTWKIINYIETNENPNRDLKFAINSNLGVPDKLIDKLIDKIKFLEDNNLVKEIILYTSCDAWGAQAEYIRHGLEFNKFWDNINKILSSTSRLSIMFMVTYNALSVFSFDQLILNIHKLKHTYYNTNRYWPYACYFDTSYLRHPKHQTVQILPDEFKQNIKDQAELVYWTAKPAIGKKYIGATDIEINKMKRIYDWAVAPVAEETLIKQRKDFYSFFSTHDQRRGTNFTKVFPELEAFYRECGEL